MDFAGKKVLVGLSGGINSMAVLCWLGNLPEAQHPEELHLYYADFKEHSDDTIQFVLDGVFWARSKFKNVAYTQSDNSVMDFFEENNFIPHPNNSKCSQALKIVPMMKYAYKHNIQIDLIGYVAKEKKRLEKAIEKGSNDLFFEKKFPIFGFDDEWCFQIVLENIGWYPKIYDIKETKTNKNGKVTVNRVFTHNNCLPCKNMTPAQLKKTQEYFPEKYARALEVEKSTGKYFGRSKCDTGCAICEF